MGMNIPDEAVEAAAKAHYELGFGSWESAHADTRAVAMEDIRAALEAAAPHMHATSEGMRDELVAILKDEANYTYVDWTPELNIEATADAIIAAGFTK